MLTPAAGTLPATRRRRAMTGPMPVEAPVRRTVLPLRSFIPQRPEPRWRLSRFPDQASRAIALFAELELRLQCLADRTLADQAALDLGPRRDLEHGVEQRLLDDRLQSARTCASKQSQLRYGIQRALLKDELDVVQREEFLVLLHERVLGLGEDANDVLLVEVLQRDDDRQAADELRDEPVLQQVLRLQQLQRL